jgi:hypothetical protein
MERFTQKSAYGTNYVKLQFDKGRWSVGHSPDDREITITGDMVNRLAAYEDAEESGMLMRLPCPMGSTIYMIVTRHTKGRDPFSFVKITEMMESNVFRVCRDIGKTVFLTKEEAQAAMEGMNNA